MTVKLIIADKDYMDCGGYKDEVGNYAIQINSIIDLNDEENALFMGMAYEAQGHHVEVRIVE